MSDEPGMLLLASAHDTRTHRERHFRGRSLPSLRYYRRHTKLLQDDPTNNCRRRHLECCAGRRGARTERITNKTAAALARNS
eukprot:1180542-Prorocentrum_minimum.AAC.3